jgi:CCR4-NOT transcriptional complex subunit CAF120
VTVAMASPPPQTNPQWDGRNQGFLSPSQLRQQLSSNDINNGYSGSLGQQNTNSPSMASSAADQSQSQQSSSPSLQPRPRQNSLTGTGHTRGPSFFSAFRKNQNTNASAGGGKPGGPGSGGAGGTVNEFGGQQDANHNAQQTAPPPPAEKPRPSGDQQQQRPSIHPEIRSVVQLTLAHARKVYFSGPLVRRVERQPDGARPHKDDGWIDVWAQLGGTTLSIWDMKSIAEASKEGKEVPPTYINIQDAVSANAFSCNDHDLY